MKTHFSILDRSGWTFLAGVLAWALTQGVSADLTHRYSFTTDARDSVGGANGTLMNDATIGSTSTGRAVFLVGTASEPACDHVDLPPGLISNYTTVSFEFWVEAGANGNWGEIFAFGTQTASGAGANMLMFCPHSGTDPNDFRMSYAQGSPGYTDEYVVNGAGVLDNRGLMSVACVYDPPHNFMLLYTNGALLGTLSPVTTGTKTFSLTNVYNVHSWLGRSLYNGDASYNGTIDEFRIYNHILSPLQVYVNSKAGPDTLVSNIVMSSVSLNVNLDMIVGTRQDSSVTFNTAAYGTVTLPGATEANYATSDANIVTVNSNGQLFAMTKGSATVSADYSGTTNTVLITVAEPLLVHRYSFAADARDSVGGANGALVGSALISGGAVILPGGVSSGDPAISYVNLPNNLVAGLTAITAEAWVTDNGSGNRAHVWDLGNSAGGEDVSDTGSRYVFLSLPSGNGTLMGSIHINDLGGENVLEWTSGGRPAAGHKAHIVWVTDLAHRKGYLFVDGVLVSVNNNMFLSPADIGPSVNDWLGRSQSSNDPGFNGAIDEFRLYHGTLSAAQVAMNAAAGPDAVGADPGALQTVRLFIGTNIIYFGGLPVTATLLANYQNVSDVNVTAVAGADFQSSNPSVAVISGPGVITATGLGQATLSGTFGGKTGTVAVTVATLPGYTSPTLVHRYSFGEAPGSTTVRDSVGSANGVIKGHGAAFDGHGQLSLPGGTSSSANPSLISGYVELPNHIINVLTNFSFETWVTWQGSSVWQRILDFGISAGGEDVSNGGDSFVCLTPMAWYGVRFFVGGESAPLTAPSALATNEEVYIAVTYDYADNVARLYSNAVLVAVAPASVNISTIDDVNNWLGRSQWPDDMFQGKFNEVRIWNGILLPDRIARHYAVGTDDDPPTSAVNSLPAHAANSSFTVTWSGTDAGSGIVSYDIYVSTNGGPWTLWLGRTTNTSAVFIGQSIRTYGFYSIARDEAGNMEEPPATADTQTTTPNQPPVIHPVAEQTIVETNALVFQVPASDPDTPPQTLTFDLVSGPPGMALDANTGVSTWSPTEAQGPGTYTVTVRVTDNWTPPLSATSTFMVVVTEANSPPALAVISNQTIDELASLNLSASATDADQPPNVLAFALVSAPEGMNIDSSSGAISWMPSEAQGPSTNVIRVRVFDNGSPSLSTTNSFTVVAQEVNAAPALSLAGNKVVNEGTLLTFTAIASDDDLPAQALVFNLDAGAPSGANLTTDGVFTWTPTELQGPSTNSVTVRVSDGVTTTAETIQIIVNEVNTAPVLNPIGNQTVSEGSLLTFTATATDPEIPVQPLTFGLDGNVPTGASIHPTTGLFTWSPTEVQGPSTNSVTVRVSDGEASSAETITIVVNEVNTAPVLSSISPQSTYAGLALTFVIHANDSDLPAQLLSFSLEGAPPGATIDPAGGQVSWTPAVGTTNGTFEFIARVTDNGNPPLSDAKTVQVMVKEMGELLLVTPGGQELAEGSTWRGTNQATDPSGLGRSLRFELLDRPAGMNLDAQTGTMEWTPTEAQGPGTNIVTVKVTDDGTPPRSATNGFTLVVTEVNEAPGLTTLGNHTVNPGQTIAFKATATDSDLPSNKLTFSLSSAPAGASIDSSSGWFSWRPFLAQAGTTNEVQVQVMDDSPWAINGEHLCNSMSFTVIVKPLRLPVLTPVANTIGQFELLVDGLVGPDYVVQSSLTLTNWFSLSTNTPAAMPFSFIDTNSGIFNKRFYRIQLGP